MSDHVVLDTTGMVYDRTFAYFDELCKQKKEERTLHARATLASLPKSVQDKGFQGDKKVEFLRDLLENGFSDDQGKLIIRSREQRQLHEVYIRSCLPKLYQNEWEDNQERILKAYGLEKLHQESLVVMPRRSGKTWSMAMFCAAMLIVGSDIEISVFATGQRTASKLLKLMIKMLTRALAYIGGDDYRILQSNKEMVVMMGPDKTERICGCYPGSVTVSENFLFLGVVVVAVCQKR